MSKIVLTERQLLDYIECPVKYDLTHNKHLAKSVPGKVSVPQALEAIARGFFATLMDGDILGVNALKKQWDIYCRNHQEDITDKKIIEGMSKIVKFYLWAERERIIIVEINSTYGFSIKHTRDTIIEYQGKVGAIAMRNKKYELLVPDFSDKLPNQYRADVRLKHTLDSLAFFRQTGDTIGIRIHNVFHDVDVYTYRGQDDFRRATNVIRNVATCITNDLIYPRENPLCTNCYLAGLCRGWTGG